MIYAVVSWAFTAALGVMLAALLARYFSPRAAASCPGISDKYDVPEFDKPVKWEAALAALALFALSRAFIALIAAHNALITSDWSRLDIFSWIRWDANHYLSLAENWYVNEGDPRFHIVFFPLYPAILRLGKVLFGLDARVFGLIVSNACLIASAAILYRLAQTEYGRARARLSATLFMFSPVTFFYSLPFSESLFFLLTVSCAYMARKRKFAWAIALGALASSARILGLVCAVVVFYEFIRGKSGLRPSDYIKYALGTSLVATGFLAYLWLNFAVTGSPFTFLQYQREHWSQSMGSVGNTLRYTLENAVAYDDFNLRLGTWIPQAAAIMLIIIILCLSFRRVSAGEGAYALIYIWFAMSATWLLSGVRYASAMYPVYFMAAALFRGRRQSVIAVASSAAMLFYMTALYLAGSVM